MDSGNSGSIQSSSGGGGGEEEYDSSSRATDSISSFTHLSHQPPQHHHHHNSTLYDPLPNYFDPNPLPNFDPMWSKTTLLSNSPNCTYSSLSLPASGALFTSSSSSPTVPFDPPKTDPAQQLPRNPKKRSRASRRAPTTVLTTDTTNFRAMVQEFTGIPAPPFTSSSSPFVRNRLDLFGTPASTRSYPLSDGLLQPPPYLLRPFAQKLQPPSPPAFNGTSNDVVSGNSTTGSNSNSVNYQMQNQILTFQSLLQSPMGNPSGVRSSGQDLLEMEPGNNDGVSRSTGAWGGGVELNGGDQISNNNHLRGVNGTYVDYSQSTGGGKGISYEKGSDNIVGGAAARATGGGGGMVESWICSSDHQ